MALEKTSVNFIPVAGKDFNVQYLLQGRNVIKENLSKGNYPFFFPGICCVWGGAIEQGETPLEGILRETNEELHLNISKDQVSTSALRIYNWEKDAVNLWGELNEFFHGNLAGFFGPSLNDKVPDCVLGKDRKSFKEIYGDFGTYFDWIKGREDHYLVVDFEQPFDATAYEGVGAFWTPHYITRSIVTSTCDKFALLDDMMRRAKAGKLDIESVKKNIAN